VRRVLVVAAHPDDEVLGCGATIAKHTRQGVEFNVLFIAEGSSCRFSNPDCVESVAAIDLRCEQAIYSLSLLGVKRYYFKNLTCGRLDQVPIIEINKSIEMAINEFQPDTVLTHWANDANNDHRIVCRATVMATRPSSHNTVKRVLSYEVLSSSEWAFGEAFAPNSFEQIEEIDLSLKWRSLAAYETEVKAYPFPRSEQGVRIQAMSRGMQAGVPLAEAFILIREFKR
jgi:LmbE family N-acetylglucosaminyl deacetylase